MRRETAWVGPALALLLASGSARADATDEQKTVNVCALPKDASALRNAARLELARGSGFTR